MGRLLTLTRSDSVQLGVRKQAFTPTIKVGRKSIGFITIVLFCVLSLFYLAQANEIATKGYQISQLEAKKTAALETKEKLEIEAARLRSIKSIQENADQQNMVQATQINYVQAKPSVAVR